MELDECLSTTNSSSNSAVPSPARSRSGSSSTQGGAPRSRVHFGFTTLNGDVEGQRLAERSIREKEAFELGLAIGVTVNERGHTVPSTPNLSEAAAQLRRTLSLASLDNLLLLSTTPDHRREFLDGARKIVWRPEGQPRLKPGDVERIFVLASSKAVRSFFLAGGIRAGISVLLLLFRTIKVRKLSLRLLLHALFGPTSLRFGIMMGLFTFLFNSSLHVLRLSPPATYLMKLARHYITHPTQRPSFGPPSPIYDDFGGTRDWHAYLSGAIAGLAILAEKKERRMGIAQQMLVRGLQAAWNHQAKLRKWKIPAGEFIVFGLSAGNIMSSWLFAPQRLPKEYDSWITSAFNGPVPTRQLNDQLVTTGKFNIDQMKQVLGWRGITAKNTTIINDLIENARHGQWPNPHVPCAVLHPAADSCTVEEVFKFIKVFQFMLPVYSALHFIPMILFKRKAFLKDPAKMLVRSAKGTVRSGAFLSGFVCIIQSLICLQHNLYPMLPFEFMKKAIVSKPTFWFMGFSTAAALLLEDKKRRGELAMYVLPRGLETFWSVARKRRLVPLVPFGEVVMSCAAMTLVMGTFEKEPEMLSGIVRRILYQFT